VLKLLSDCPGTHDDLIAGRSSPQPHRAHRAAAPTAATPTTSSAAGAGTRRSTPYLDASRRRVPGAIVEAQKSSERHARRRDAEARQQLPWALPPTSRMVKATASRSGASRKSAPAEFEFYVAEVTDAAGRARMCASRATGSSRERRRARRRSPGPPDSSCSGSPRTHSRTCVARATSCHRGRRTSPSWRIPGVPHALRRPDRARTRRRGGRVEFTTAMATRSADTSRTTSRPAGRDSAEGYKKRFIALVNERSADYAGFRWTDEGPNTASCAVSATALRKRCRRTTRRGRSRRSSSARHRKP